MSPAQQPSIGASYTTATCSSVDSVVRGGTAVRSMGDSGHGSAKAAAVPRVPSMLFDIELNDEEREGGGPADTDTADMRCLKQYLRAGSTGEVQLRSDVEQALRMQQWAAGGGGMLADAAATVRLLAASLTRKGYACFVRTALGGGAGTDCLRNLRHTHLTVLPPGGHASTARFVVDPSFREQFRIAKPTPRYQALLDCLPDTHVAPEASITPLVNFLCAEMATAFRATGTVLPPWRAAGSLLSKWLPRKSMDEQVLLNRCAAAAGNHATQQAGGAAAALPASYTARRSACMPSSGGQHAGNARGQQQQQQQARMALGVVSVAAGGGGGAVKRPHAAVAAALTSAQLQPIVCEPQRVLVGGNFAAIGF